MNPARAPTPIQYQRAFVKIPRDFKTNTPKGSLIPGGTLKENFESKTNYNHGIFLHLF